MAKNKQDLEITLQDLEIPSLARKSVSRHILQASLLWPRVSIAKKSQEQPIELLKGKINGEKLNWGKRMLFKESIEGHFGLSLAITVSLTQTEWENFFRYFFSQSLKLAAGFIDNYEPAGDLIAIPLKYGSKELQENKPPKIYLKGDWDIDLNDLGDLPQVIRIPLLTTQKRLIGGTVSHSRNNGSERHNAVTIPAGSPDGFAELRLAGL